MKQTPLTQTHIDMNARMMEFAGYNMPVSYTTISQEHTAVRNHAGLFDVSHMGQFFIKGPNALDLLQKIGSNDASKMIIGQAQYTCMPNDKGGIVDDLIAYRLSEEEYMLVVNAANIQKDWAWIDQCNTQNVSMEDRSDKMALLALQGPKANAILAQLTDIKVDQIPFYHFGVGEVCGVPNVIVSATGYTGSGGYELYLDNVQAKIVWDKLMEVGADHGLEAVGLGARDTLRLEMGYCLYGNDIDDTTSPLEAGLGWITKLKKEADFNSKDIFLAQKSAGIDKKLVGFMVDDRRVPRFGYEIVNEAGDVIGKVTSGTMSPSLDRPIGLGYVNKEYSKSGNHIYVKIRNKILPATVQKLPFYKA